MKSVTAIRHLAAFAVALALSQGMAAMPARADTTGPSALALAAVVAAHSSVLSSYDRRVMARLFTGGNVSFPPTRKISVTADSIVCKVSNVSIASRSCELTFGAGKRNFTGREANELFATLAAAGVMPDGAAGTIYEAVKMLDCTIDPTVIKENAGGGADCTFMPGQ
jgi:hypothetical protein